MVGAEIVNSVWIRRRTGTGVIQMHDGKTYQPVTITTSWVKYSFAATLIGTTSTFALRINDSGDEIDIYQAQHQDKTGASDPTVPDAYCSTGVLSAPYHGAGVDGVCYYTSTNGNTVP